MITDFKARHVVAIPCLSLDLGRCRGTGSSIGSLPDQDFVLLILLAARTKLTEIQLPFIVMLARLAQPYSHIEIPGTCFLGDAKRSRCL